MVPVRLEKASSHGLQTVSIYKRMRTKHSNVWNTNIWFRIVFVFWLTKEQRTRRNTQHHVERGAKYQRFNKICFPWVLLPLCPGQSQHYLWPGQYQLWSGIIVFFLPRSKLEMGIVFVNQPNILWTNQIFCEPTKYFVNQPNILSTNQIFCEPTKYFVNDGDVRKY